ncbi:RNA-binding protein Musashi homolog 1-like [Convolutriloba macropyga]|uniref:RNA-binding protein Musashi homolog 1-like n=1 Tax=Convolutriloba macropyga TaxID=536237 RepID=UPI003F5235DE
MQNGMGYFQNVSNGRSQQEIEKRFNEAEDERKLFVGGLSWSTTDEDLLRYFARFGAVDEAAMKKGRDGTPRGFAFIIYMDNASVEKVMQSGPHVLNGRKIDPKRARSENNNGRARPRKIFVKNSKACSEEELRGYFGSFGEITNIDLPVYTNDDGTFSRREYCFIEFDSEEAAIDACADGSHIIGQTTVETKKFDAKQSGAAVAKGGPPDMIRAKRQQRYAPYGMGGPQNMGNGYYPNSAGFMNNFDGSSQMNNFMGSPYQSHMGIRNTPVMGGGHFGGMGGSGFGGGGRFNGGDQYGGFGGNFSPMQNAQFGARGMGFGGNGAGLPNNYMEVNPTQGFYNSPPGGQNFTSGGSGGGFIASNSNNMASSNNRSNGDGSQFYTPRRGGGGGGYNRGGGGGRYHGNNNQNIALY